MEGKMSKFRASLVCERSLAQSAREIDLGSYLFLGKGEAATGGAERDSILSDAFEAVIGAIYLDAGMEEASRFIHQYVLSAIEHKTRPFYRRWYKVKAPIRCAIICWKKRDRITAKNL